MHAFDEVFLPEVKFADYESRSLLEQIYIYKGKWENKQLRICQECETKLNVIIVFIIKIRIFSKDHKILLTLPLGFHSFLVNVKSKWNV